MRYPESINLLSLSRPDNPSLSLRLPRRIAWERAFSLLAAILLGCLVAYAAALSTILVFGAVFILCLFLGLWILGLTDWPVRAILRFALVVSFSFRMEIHLFDEMRYNEPPPGLNLSLTLILSVILLFIHLKERWEGKPAAPISPLSFTLLSLGLFLWCLISIAGSSERRLGFYSLWYLGASLLICFVIANEFRTPQSLKVLVFTFAIMIGINSVVALLQARTGMFVDWTFLGAAKEESRKAIGEGEYMRTGGFLGKANYFAWYLVTLLPILFSLLILGVRQIRTIQRCLMWGVSAVGVMALINTYSRGSWLAFMVAIIAVAVLSIRFTSRDVRKRVLVRLTVLIVLATIGCAPFANAIYIRLTEDDRGAAYVRIPLMQVAQGMIADNLWLGVGLANYEAEMGRYDETAEKISEYFPWPVHNIFLHSVAEAGVPAMVLFIFLIVIVWRRGMAAARQADPFLQALGIGLVSGMIGFLWTGLKELGSFGSPQYRLLFMLFGVLLALGWVVEKSPAPEEQSN